MSENKMKMIPGRAQPANAVSLFVNLNIPMSSISPPPPARSRWQMLPNPSEQPHVPHITPSTMNPPRLGMSCARSVAVHTCPVLPILPPNHTRRSQAVQSLSPPVILALSWPQSKIKNSAVVVTTCAVSTSTSKLSENIQFGHCNHPGCMCISLPSQPYYHDVL